MPKGADNIPLYSSDSWGLWESGHNIGVDEGREDEEKGGEGGGLQEWGWGPRA